MRICPHCNRPKELHDLTEVPVTISARGVTQIERRRTCLLKTVRTHGDIPIKRADDEAYNRRMAAHEALREERFDD